MSEVIERSSIASPCISRIARTFNSMPIDSTVQGMKKAAYLDRQIEEALKEQERVQGNPVEEKEQIPTGAQIRQDREVGEYR